MNYNQPKSKEYWKEKIKSQIQKRQLKKQIFGQHYNHSKININKNRKNFNEEVKIMQIQKSNYLLLSKIKKIAQRSRPRMIIQRARTQVTQQQDKQQILSRIIRRNTTIQDQKRSNRYKSTQNNLQRLNNRSDSVRTLLKTKPNEQQFYNPKIIIYRGKRLLNNIMFSFTIFIQNQIYNILSETKSTQQNIQIPIENYQLLLKEELNSVHQNVFKILKVKENHKLELIGSKKMYIDLMETSEIDINHNQTKTLSLHKNK